MSALALQPRLAALRPVLLPVLTALAVLSGWEALVRGFAVPAMILPPPSAIATTLADGLPLILVHAVPTAAETAAGFLIALLFGVLLAALLDISRLAREALFPNLVLFQLIPKVALAPLFIVWFGIGSSSRLAYATFIAFFPILIATATGLRSAPGELLRLARSVGATPWQAFRTIRVPAALPYLLAGMKVAATMAIIGIVVGEFITSQRGLGYLILFAASKAETALVFACIAVLCAVGLGLFGLVALLEAAVRRWLGPA